MIIITTPAPDPTLLMLEEISEALGAGHGLSNTALRRLNERVSELIAAACNLERIGAATLTLREETLTESVTPQSSFEVIYLSRGPIIEVLSVTEDGTELVLDDGFELTGGGIMRLSSGSASTWATAKSIVSYRAGFAVVPPGLKELAAKLALVLHSERGRDPSLGSTDIPGVISETYRYGRPDDPLIPAEIMEGLRFGGFVRSQTMIA